MDMRDGACQAKDRERMSTFATPLIVYRFFWFLRREGVAVTARKTWWHLFGKAPRNNHPKPASNGSGPGPAPALEESLNLQVGEWVEVKSEAEILATLDAAGRNKGMQFMPQMRRYCGRRFRVYKRLESLLFEESQQRRRIRNTVLLDGLICDGDGVGCDRSCFFFWRETWLKKVDGPAAEDTSNGKAVNLAYDIDVGALGKKPESPRPV